MPLRPNARPIEIPFGYGIDQRTDKQLVLPGKLIELENATFPKLGRVAKRPGVAAVPSSAQGAKSGTLYATDDALTVRESLSGSAEGTANVISVSDQRQAYTGSAIFPRLECDQLAPLVVTARCVDGALDPVGRAVGLCSAIDDAQTATLISFDFATKRQLAYVSYANGFNTTRVLPTATAGVFLVALGKAAQLAIYKLNVSGGSITGQDGFGWGTTAPQATQGPNLGSWWDWCLSANGALLYVLSIDTGLTTLTITKYDTTTWSSSSATIAVTSPTSIAIGLGTGPSVNTLGVVWTTASGVFFRGYNATTMALVTGTTTIHNVAGAYDSCTINCDPSSGLFHVLVQENVSPTATYNRRVIWGRINAFGVGFSANYIHGAALASKMAPNSRTFAVTYDAPLQRSLLFHQINNAGSATTLQGRTLYGRHAGISFTSFNFLPLAQDVGIASATSPDFFMVTLSAQESTATGAAPLDILGPTWVQAQQASLGTPDRVYPSASFDGRTLFGGGFPHRLTPKGPEAAGLLLNPTIESVTPNTSSGSIPDGTYGVICTYEVVDADGNVWESGPSIPVFATITGSGGAGRLTVVVQNYRVEPTRNNVFAVFYRALPGSSTYYREARVQVSPTSNSTTHVLLLASATLDDQAILYSQGEQENAMPDGPIALCADQDRVWCVPGSSRNRVLPSKPFRRGVGLAWFPEVYRQVAASGGAINALAHQDNTLWAFKSTTAHVASGEGPDATGANDTLSEFSERFPHIGAESSNAVLKGSSGLYVRSGKDIWFIGRDGQYTRISAEIEDLAKANFLGAANITDLKQVRFLFGDSSSATQELVFDEEVRAWSVNTRPASPDYRLPSLAYFNKRAHYVFPLANAATPCLFREDPTIFADNGVQYALRILTAWLKPAQVLNGFGVVYEAMLLGESLADHTLQVRVRYDNETAWSETHTITSADATTGNGVYEPKIYFHRRKCKSLQFEITELNPDGQGFALTGLTLLAGALPGLTRTRAAKGF